MIAPEGNSYELGEVVLPLRAEIKAVIRQCVSEMVIRPVIVLKLSEQSAAV